MSKGIRRGNRVSTGWFFGVGLLLLVLGGALLIDLITLAQGDGPGSGDGISDAEIDARVILGFVCVSLGALSLQVWLIAFAITVGLVETNRRLERLEHLPALDFYAEQRHLNPAEAPNR